MNYLAMSGESGSNFRCDASSREAILKAAAVSDPKVGDELILECEAVSRIHLNIISYYRDLAQQK
jgi:hypothetical protein